MNKKDFDRALKAEEMIGKATIYVSAQNYLDEANKYLSEENYDKAYSAYNNAIDIYEKLGIAENLLDPEQYAKN